MVAAAAEAAATDIEGVLDGRSVEEAVAAVMAEASGIAEMMKSVLAEPALEIRGAPARLGSWLGKSAESAPPDAAAAAALQTLDVNVRLEPAAMQGT